ncbi:Excinuclease ABC C subunit domain protein [Pseudopedobacter saltans DSM 12145]|uniref:Excinuclease ABC C subunit domain protein n=2 Tax=Pseudopedobacter saltans TaxID=151895 RepID=F0SDT6_PSESL|nr:Excinuclease ABC C subunit domain protein [Pseudopedobacter saltans DSM 12145]
MMYKGGFVYILTNKNKTVLYIGVTSDLKGRIWEHMNSNNRQSFTFRYNVLYLVYYEFLDSISQAIDREKQLKRWSREKKEDLINKMNPTWGFLNDEVAEDVYSLI